MDMYLGNVELSCTVSRVADGVYDSRGFWYRWCWPIVSSVNNIVFMLSTDKLPKMMYLPLSVWNLNEMLYVANFVIFLLQEILQTTVPRDNENNNISVKLSSLYHTPFLAKLK